MAARPASRSARRAPLVLALLLASGACASDGPARAESSAPAASPAAPPSAPSAPSAPTTPAAPSAPAVPSATVPAQAETPAPPPAPAAAAQRTVEDFQWPDPLPPCSPDAPPLYKGLVIGTWVPEGENGFDQAWVDERALREAWTKESASRRTWKGFAVSSPAIAVDSLLDDRQGPAAGYVFSLVVRNEADPAVEDAPAVLHLRHRGRARVFVDGMPLIDAAAPPAGSWGEERARVVLTGPYTVVLLKLGRGSAQLGESMDVEVRLSAPDGSPLPRQAWNTMRPGSVHSEG